MFTRTKEEYIYALNKSEFCILVVEDSRLINDFLTKSFQNDGYSCYQSYDLQNAKHFLNEHKVTLVILDLHLPDGEGEELILEIQKVNKKAKVVIFTSDNDLSRRDELFKHGILDYVIKGKAANLILKDLYNIIENIQINPQYTILIVDDSSVVRRMIRDILTPAGYQLLEAKNGEEALQSISTNKIDLVLLDMEMPDLNGNEVLKKIKENEKNFKLPVFIISSNLNVETIRDAYKMGCWDYFRKPFSPEELKLKIEQVIAIKHKELELEHSAGVANKFESFISTFCANAIFSSDLKPRWHDEKFIEYFGSNKDYVTQVFKNFDQNAILRIVANMRKNKPYKELIKDKNEITYLFKLFPLEHNDCLASIEKL